MIIKSIFMGLLFGYGAAVPIGPINVEMVRRNLQSGVACGLSFGLGAGLADITYLALLSLGALTILIHPTLLRIISVLGAAVLAWFGIMAFRAKGKSGNVASPTKDQSVWRHAIDSYLLTLLNPYTILFWTSVSTQVANYSNKAYGAAIAIGSGVFMAVMSWIFMLNLILHYTKHRLPEKSSRYLNIIGGSILIVFAVLCLWHAIK